LRQTAHRIIRLDKAYLTGARTGAIAGTKLIYLTPHTRDRSDRKMRKKTEKKKPGFPKQGAGIQFIKGGPSRPGLKITYPGVGHWKSLRMTGMVRAIWEYFGRLDSRGPVHWR